MGRRWIRASCSNEDSSAATWRTIGSVSTLPDPSSALQSAGPAKATSRLSATACSIGSATTAKRPHGPWFAPGLHM